MELPSLRRRTVHRLLANIGFKHEKRGRNLLLINRDDITDWRNRYLRDVERYRAEAERSFIWTRHGSWWDTIRQSCGQTPWS
ncbi:hypothetical protein MRX96_008542 [Rhipicephalus microplus]